MTRAPCTRFQATRRPGCATPRTDVVGPLEGGGEGEGAAAADLAGDGGEGVVGVARPVGGEGEPPAGEVGHRGFADEPGEAAGERGPGDAGLLGEPGDGPRAGRVVLDQPQHRPDDRVGQGLVRAREPGPQGGDDEQVEQPVQDNLLTGGVPPDLLHQQRGERALLTGFGVPGKEAAFLVEVFATLLDGRNARVEDGVRRVLGRGPRDFSDVVREAAADGAWKE